MDRPQTSLDRTAGPLFATCIVIANVIGAGIFTTPGFLARDLGSPFAVISIWLIGALPAVAGALSYSELAAAFPEAGGEYVYLREAFGPLWGYLSGWTSFFAGFAAPIAAATIGFAAYLSYFAPTLDPEQSLWSIHIGPLPLRVSAAQIVALAALWMLSMAHITGMRRSGRLHVLLTAAKVLSIAAFIVLSLWLGRGQWGNFTSGSQGTLPPGVFRNAAVSLIFVLYSYSGWNASAYIAGEVRRPNRVIPLSLLAGTGIVMILYLGLNVVFIYTLGIDGMSGVLQVGEKASLALFGEGITGIISLMIALSILASVSAMVVAGRLRRLFDLDPKLHALGTTEGVLAEYCYGRAWPAALCVLAAETENGDTGLSRELHFGITSLMRLTPRRTTSYSESPMERDPK